MKCVTFRCACCKRVLPRNPRVKQQRYCGSAACQRARKAKWQREKMSEDRDYQATQRESQRLWQQNNPDYWRQYRRNNCDYRRRNRLLQRARDDVSRCRQPSTGNSLAKMDTLNRILDDTTMTYIIFSRARKSCKNGRVTSKNHPIYGRIASLAKKDSIAFRAWMRYRAQKGGLS